MTQVGDVWRRRFGDLDLAVISEGTGLFPTAAWPSVSAADWTGIDTPDADGQVALGFNVAYVDTPAGGILLDPGFGEPSEWTRAFQPRFGIRQTGDVMATLATLDVSPALVRAVVISHAHNDHLFGATVVRDGKHVPAFPNAQYYLGAADWAHYGETAAPDSPFHRIVGALHAAGRLTLVERDTTIAPGVTLLLTPGETPGHLSARLESGGETVYYVGDLVHHIAEIIHPDWVPSQRSAATLVPSRQSLLREAADRHALVVASHIPFPGVVRVTDRNGAFAADSVAAG